MISKHLPQLDLSQFPPKPDHVDRAAMYLGLGMLPYFSRKRAGGEAGWVSTDGTADRFYWGRRLTSQCPSSMLKVSPLYSSLP